MTAACQLHAAHPAADPRVSVRMRCLCLPACLPSVRLQVIADHELEPMSRSLLAAPHSMCELRSLLCKTLISCADLLFKPNPHAQVRRHRLRPAGCAQPAGAAHSFCGALGGVGRSLSSCSCAMQRLLSAAVGARDACACRW